MNLGVEDKKKMTILGVAGTGAIAAAIYMYTQLSTPDVPPPVVAPVAVSAPARTGSTTSGTSARASSSTAVLKPATISGAPAGIAASKVGTTLAQYDPTLKMDAMLVTEALVYSGSGRNIFSQTSTPEAPIVIPKIKAPVRTAGVVLPVYTPPPGPPPPPPIELKFFGTATRSDGSRQAFLLHGDDVFLASAGSIVQRRYKVGTIQSSSVEVEDLTNSNKQTLQLQRN